MLDINDFVAERGGDPEKIRESQRKRHAPVEVVDQVIAQYEHHRKTQYKVTEIKAEINATQKEIGAKKKAKEDADDLLKKKVELEESAKRQTQLAEEELAKLHKLAKTIGNYVDGQVPISDNEDNNKELRTWSPDGKPPGKPEGCLSHHEVLTRLGGYDPVRGVKVVGHRGYCLVDAGFFLNRAMVNYAMDFLYTRGYHPNQPPYFMNRSAMSKTAQLEQFDEELYKVEEGGQGEDKYLIATSEQPLSALHESEWLQEKDLPIQYAGYSTCFRKEAGSHGKDAWGIFRVHQFEKIEQFVFCRPADSQKHFADMINHSEDFYKSLKLPYHVVAIVSGALNNAAAVKYDLEAWFPYQSEYKELVSCSNCTDYQTRELEIRYGPKDSGKDTSGGASKTAADKKDAKTAATTGSGTKKMYVHALNATLCATQRALCCVLENYQTPDGVNVPEVLRKYIPGEPSFLPYVRELPKDSTSTKSAGGKDASAKVKGGAQQLVDRAKEGAAKVGEKVKEMTEGA